jgi:hypothetical protein
MQSPKKTVARGMAYWPARYYRNRYECQFWGSYGMQIRSDIRKQWGDTDDMVWDSGENFNEYAYSALITPQQLSYILLKWG